MMSLAIERLPSFQLWCDKIQQLFFCAPDHRLEKSDICEHLWPRKPDASATLYTLIRRIKPIIEQQSGLRIECERGRSYTLIPS